jgi:hypothetical protein
MPTATSASLVNVSIAASTFARVGGTPRLGLDHDADRAVLRLERHRGL